MALQSSSFAMTARSGIVLQDVPAQDDVEERLIHSRRYVHAVAAFNNGREAVHIISIYGFSGAGGCPQRMAKNEQLLHDVLHVQG